MVKTRIIGVVLVKEGIAVQSIGFRRYLPIGVPEIAINYLDRWGIDEIAVLHMDATLNPSRRATAAQVNRYAKECQVPLAVGGGITEISQVKEIIQSGADKVIMNASLLARPELITEAAHLFGNQCVVVSIDARHMEVGTYRAFTHSGKTDTGLNPLSLAQKAEELGAGEIFLNSIDRDGSKKGYDIDLMTSVSGIVGIPVIGCGGASHPSHMQTAMRSGLSAVAAANFFHFTEHSVIAVKRYLQAQGEAVRLDSYVNYRDLSINEDGRVGRMDDRALDELRFRYIPEETI